MKWLRQLLFWVVIILLLRLALVVVLMLLPEDFNWIPWFFVLVAILLVGEFALAIWIGYRDAGRGQR